jgi:branched-subunit amino acid transport protein
MFTWRQSTVGVSRREFGAGVVAAVAALFASLFYLPALQFSPLALSADAQYWVGYAPQFAALAGLVVGTLVWRRAVSRESTPKQGALAGIVTAVGTVVLVPTLAGLYVLLFPVVLGPVTGAEWSHVLHVLPAYVRASVGVTRTVAVSWSPLVGFALVPLGALVGWAYQRGRRPCNQ